MNSKEFAEKLRELRKADKEAFARGTVTVAFSLPGKKVRLTTRGDDDMNDAMVFRLLDRETELERNWSMKCGGAPLPTICSSTCRKMSSRNRIVIIIPIGCRVWNAETLCHPT